jgi:Spherulation-specific family 4
MKHIKFAWALALTANLWTFVPLPGTMVRADEVVALVPAYFYPSYLGSPWDDLNTAAARIPIEAIMNPDSGPGPGVNSDYVTAVQNLQAAGGKVIGYVATGYGARASEDILNDISNYINWYGVDGIFLDEMGNSDGTLDYVGLYQSIQALAAGSGTELHVVGNPGEPFSEAFIAAADTLVIFEGPYANSDPTGASFESYPNKGPYTGLSEWWQSYRPSQIANIVYSDPTQVDALKSVVKALRQNAGYLYITDATLPNPYGALPTYWDDEVGLIEIINYIL